MHLCAIHSNFENTCKSTCTCKYQYTTYACTCTLQSHCSTFRIADTYTSTCTCTHLSFMF